MARRIISQKEALEKMAEEERRQKEEVEKAKEELSVLDEKLRKMQEEFEKSSKARKGVEQELAHLKEEEEKKQAELKRLSKSEANAQTEVTRLVSKKIELQNKIKIAKGVAIPHTPRRIRSANQSDVEIGRTPTIYRYNTSLIIPENSLFTKANVGDYVSYVGEGDENTTTWRVWKKTDSNVVITPVLDSSCRRLELSGIDDYLDIVKNAGTQTDKINRACKEWYVNASLGITAENIRTMTIEDINEVCGYTVPKITERYAYYPCGTSVSGTEGYNGNMYTKKAHTDDCFNGCTEPRIYTYDGGGVEKTDENGYKYRKPEWNNPVYVSNTYYCYDPSYYNHIDNSSVTIGSMLGSSFGWLASPCISIYSSYVHFNVRSAYQSGVIAYQMTDSDGYRYGLFRGVRSLVSLSSRLKAVGGEGTSESPWQMGK